MEISSNNDATGEATKKKRKKRSKKKKTVVQDDDDSDEDDNDEAAVETIQSTESTQPQTTLGKFDYKRLLLSSIISTAWYSALIIMWFNKKYSVQYTDSNKLFEWE